MPKTMLIDATHSEETRVAVVDGHRLVEYDYESKVRKQLKGSVFLAKVTRVEPSLQAAFVNFGGNRHGFLPFSEIHPDYYRIPVADRDALIAAQRAELEEHDNELEQAEAVLEQRASEGEEGSAGSAETHEDDEEEDIEAVVEVGGEDQPLLDDEDHAPSDASEETQEDSEEEDDGEEYRAPIAMDAKADMLRGPSVEDDSDAEQPDADFEHDEDSEDESETGEVDMDEESDDDMDEHAEDGQPSETGEDDQQDMTSPGEQILNENGEAVPRDENRNRGNRGRGRGRHGGGNRGRSGGRDGGRGRHGGSRHDRDDRSVESIGGDGVDTDRPFRFNLKRSYKIQEVIKRGQIMLIQVSKEERGNKGAAVTTYLSMPGRYCVLMPNSPRGGGVSRKIASFKDRKRMKDMLDDLSVPEGMSVILRTAGVARTKVEIKRDLDYLTRLWNTIREHTLKSTAPALIYEEGNLIKRAIRDLYSRDIEDVYVSGDEGYKNAKEFMKMLMPSHAKKVQEYKNDRIPMFHKFNVENQIYEMGEPTVNLKSGGYLVINPTEALVSVDVNSGRATKERHIEDTALKTNLEAADEVARQLRLRDLGGLVVIDFIDMEDRRNNRKVEQRLRDALSTDRARIQVGRISSFGLLELSRQRLNPSLAEAQQEVCQHCMGTGRVKTLDFSAISIIRALEVEGIKGKNLDIIVTMNTDVALYIMNHKRSLLNDIERRYGFEVSFVTDNTMSASQYKLETTARMAPKISEGIVSVAVMDEGDLSEEEDYEDENDDEGMEDASERTASDRAPREPRADRGERPDRAEGDGETRRRRGRRGGRNRRGGRDRDPAVAGQSVITGDEEQPSFDGNFDAEESIGNRIENDPELGRDDNRGNREPRSPRDGAPREGGRDGGRSRRGGRGRGRGDKPQGDRSQSDRPQSDRPQGDRQQADRAPRPPREDDGGNRPSLREDRPLQTEPQPHIQTPIQVVQQTQAQTASNDRRPSEPAAPREYEKVNEAPEKKKKGWWNKLVE